MHKALGRGLDALLPTGKAASSAAKTGGGESVLRVDVNKITPNRSQPRTHFSDAALQDLAESIKVHGIAQPLLVCPTKKDGEYELVAGERRLRAAKLLGYKDVPCVVREVSDRQRHELSLIENIQREDLNVIEEAESIQKLMKEFTLKQEDVAIALGRSRSAIANKLRLLELPPALRQAVVEERLSEGHARTLLGISDTTRQMELGRRVINERITVREVEKIVADWQSASQEGRVRPIKKKNADLRHLEEELQRELGRRVEIQAQGPNKGWLKLGFYSVNDLESLIKKLKKTKDAVLSAEASEAKAPAPKAAPAKNASVRPAASKAKAPLPSAAKPKKKRKK